ncbi:hepatoma-derived growth factor-related protein 2-like [Actinia tenebrosa]|uniref:Hepatoma-derived growth factor-related protein 2-like n=1 Tax=Actinia tenebrosa TaxID=6105 RepID=A0A6P8IWQ8_ACTTE|nr:hepatoma-derived growth factor-related protein 2-like [Actinia tenebrosa]
MEREKEKERREKEKQKEREKLEWQKHKERLKNPTIYDTLELCNQDLRLSLTVEAPDIQKCLNTLNKINDMQISPDVIKKSPAIVQTIKRIRNYKQSNKVKERASEVYTKLKSLFIVTGADVPVTPTTKTTSNPFTPAEQKNLANSSKPPVMTEERVDGKVAPASGVRPVEESTEPTLAEAKAVHDKENVLLDHKTQNGAHSVENSIPSHAQDLGTTPMEDTQSYNEKTLPAEMPRNDDQTEILTPCDMEISSPI